MAEASVQEAHLQGHHILGQQIEEIRTLPNRSLAYATLLHLQRCSADDPSAMAALAVALPPLLPALLGDISHKDEEIAAQALKCLGFMLYHPTLVHIFTEEVAQGVLDPLMKLIMTTPMKAICNLGVWCISVQQLCDSVVKIYLELLVNAIVYALDNPFHSLSITFEAAQALTKLSNMFPVEMRNMSNIWAPPIYKRLISIDKRDRDIAERCLLKMKFIICPPPLGLSKVISSDLVQALLATMIELSHDRQQRVFMINAWGWYICLLGTDALRDRHLLNKMLKVPERTFADHDQQVQVASLVAWKSFIDVFLPPQDHVLGKIPVVVQQTTTAPSSIFGSLSDKQINSLLKRIKVLMTPLCGIISSKCHISVHIAFLNTWYYLLHKLELMINHPSLLTTTFWSILEIIFSKGLHDQNKCLWFSCLHLLNEFVVSKVKAGEEEIVTDNSFFLEEGTKFIRNSEALWNDSLIQWLPWDISDSRILLDIISTIICPERMKNMTSECTKQSTNAALKIFTLFLKGVKVEVKKQSVSHEKMQCCIDNILKFIDEVHDAVALKMGRSDDLSRIHCLFTKAVTEELESAIASSLYRTTLNLKYLHE